MLETRPFLPPSLRRQASLVTEVHQLREATQEAACDELLDLIQRVAELDRPLGAQLRQDHGLENPRPDSLLLSEEPKKALHPGGASEIFLLIAMSRSVLMLLGTYSPAAHQGIARYAAEHGWHLHMDMARIPVIPRGWTGDGIIAALGEWEAPVNFVRSAMKRGIPVVDILTIHPDINLPRVVGDHLSIGRLAAEHFLERGWRHFYWFSRVNHAVANLRFEGYQSILHDHGYQAHHLLEKPSKQWDRIQARLSKALLAAPKPMAVFAYNDFDAALIIGACMEAGCRVPDDVAVLGVDDNDLVVNSLHVALSSVRLNLERISYKGCEVLETLMEGKQVQPLQLVPPRGIAVRQSTDTFAVNNDLVRRTLGFIKDHLHRSLGVDEIVTAMGGSRRALEMAVRSELRQSLHQVIVRLRVSRARELLLTTRLPIQDIAAQTGFCHASHMHRIFLKSYGTAPTTLRKSAAEELPGTP